MSLPLTADSAAHPSAVARLLARFDLAPGLLVPALALIAIPLIGSPSTWLTLTFAGLAMGMIVFLTASGLTVIFGLMDIVNFGHGVFIAFGAYVATSALGTTGLWSASDFGSNAGALLLAIVAAMIVAGLIGLGFERVIVRPVYGRHLKQILVTMGAGIIGEELIRVIWGPTQIALPLPEGLRGSLYLGDAAIPIYRLLAIVIGGVVFAAMSWVLARTKIGLLIRAGVEDREMVEALGYRISRVFIAVFVTGSALAGVGGAMWGLFQQNLVPQLGTQVNVLVFIVVIIGGMGSTTGALIGALLVGLVTNYVAFLVPVLSDFADIGLMAAVLLWRPHGLYPVARR